MNGIREGELFFPHPVNPVLPVKTPNLYVASSRREAASAGREKNGLTPRRNAATNAWDDKTTTDADIRSPSFPLVFGQTEK